MLAKSIALLLLALPLVNGAPAEAAEKRRFDIAIDPVVGASSPTGLPPQRTKDIKMDPATFAALNQAKGPPPRFAGNADTKIDPAVLAALLSGDNAPSMGAPSIPPMDFSMPLGPGMMPLDAQDLGERMMGKIAEKFAEKGTPFLQVNVVAVQMNDQPAPAIAEAPPVPRESLRHKDHDDDGEHDRHGREDGDQRILNVAFGAGLGFLAGIAAAMVPFAKRRYAAGNKALTIDYEQVKTLEV